MANNPFWTSKGTEDFDGIQVPTRYIIDAPDPDSAGAEQLISQNKDVISKFLEAQRRNYSLSTIGVHNAFTITPDIAIHYQNVNGQETVRLTPYPQTSSSSQTLPVPPAVPSESSGPGPLIPPVPESLYMMVMYKGPSDTSKATWVAAIDMSALPAAQPVYSGSTGQGVSIGRGYLPTGGSSFNYGPIPVAQYSFNGQGVIMTPINFRPKSSIASTYYLWTTALDLTSDADGVATQCPLLNDDTNSYLYSGYVPTGVTKGSTSGTNVTTVNPRLYPPIINGSNGNIYTPLDTYTLSKGKFTRIGNGGDPGGVCEIDSVSYAPSIPYTISPDGDYYYSAQWTPAVVYTFDPTLIAAASAPEFNALGCAVMDLQGSAWSTGCSPSAITASVVNTWFGARSPQYPDGVYIDQPSGPIGYIYGKSTAGGTPFGVAGNHLVSQNASGESYQLTLDYSGSLPYPEFDTSSGVLNTALVPVIATSEVDATDEPTICTLNVFDAAIRTSNVDDGTVSPSLNNPAIQLYPFPPSLSQGQGGIDPHYYGYLEHSGCTYAYMGQVSTYGIGPISAPSSVDLSGNLLVTPHGPNDPLTENRLGVASNLTVHTPYGEFTVESNDGIPGFFLPWLHVSNGQHYAQGFCLGDTSNPYLYLDGQEYMTALTAGLSTPTHTVQPQDIRAIFFDLHLADIKKLSDIDVYIPLS